MAKLPTAALVDVFARQIAQLNGSPATVVTANLPTNNSTLLVESTLAFPPTGHLWIKGEQYTYSSKTSTSFVDLRVSTESGVRSSVIGARTPVVLWSLFSPVGY